MARWRWLTDRGGERWVYLTFAVSIMLVISLSLVLEWFAVWNWASLVITDSPVEGTYIFGIWSFAFVPALLGAAGVVPFYPAGESWTWRLTVALIFSVGAGALRFGVEMAVWGRAFMVGPWVLEGLLAVAVPFSCITVSMYLAKSQVRAVQAERLMAEMEFEARAAALERENAELKVRREISAVLHDQVQQRLVFAASRLQSEVIPMAELNDDQVAISLLREIIQDIDHLREDDVRQLSHSLFPVGADIGLHQAMALAIGRVPASVSVALEVSENAAAFDTVLEPALDVGSRAVVVSVLDEAVTNALKHGSARSITVALDLADDSPARRLVLTVSNDGQPLADGARPAGGLAGHQLRLEARGGGLELRMNESGQTELSAWLPLPEPPEQPEQPKQLEPTKPTEPPEQLHQPKPAKPPGNPQYPEPPEPPDRPEPTEPTRAASRGLAPGNAEPDGPAAPGEAASAGEQ
ncbi:MAG: hypothetical protein LBC97_08775 [Bifidobacteriaceae bacterium]|jgi:signal transduction histidine kinase|nr:hypothetical protein [Bifidobacteriaceae bacterium]